MHPEIQENKPGKCPKCGGMDLVEKGNYHSQAAESNNYRPLVIIIGLITLISYIASFQGHHGMSGLHGFMTSFMAGFFLVFSGFKLLDLKGFAHGYAQYDLLAKRVYVYGYIYPFIELLLGLAYLMNFQPIATNIVTFLLMTFSGIGVAIKMQKKETFQCACLGTFLRVPLTKITLIEDFGMAIMALYMVIIFSN